ncbi:Fe2+-dependent dioxygenase [Hyphococcus luteus]|uniref:Fe2+-dependent dioxygenase n=1 Tax=Hyphococcus luteus TaxID=2058213 RepID=A0A2S7JYM8_9PROT|nr:Fe2+-dependent dioxygenase [Marinicaulis flavus]PQA85355.1 Fe2+-dependent dioxygenase [Marinicaulis flavus]
MLLHIDKVLTKDDCRAILDALDAPALWRDGKATAMGGARAVKDNQQADAASPAAKGVLSKIEAALAAHPVFKAAAQPASFARLALNRYGEGMAYGDHVDAPYIDGTRTDLSFTVFLTEPDEYEGGALVVDNAGHEDAIRGAAGSVVLYPSSSLHRVEEVTSGARIACIGWVKSRIRSSEQRALVFELETALADLKTVGAPLGVYNRLLNLRNNLLRTFGD